MKRTDVIALPRETALSGRGAARPGEAGFAVRPVFALAEVVVSSRSGIAPEAARRHLSAILESLTLPSAG